MYLRSASRREIWDLVTTGTGSNPLAAPSIHRCDNGNDGVKKPRAEFARGAHGGRPVQNPRNPARGKGDQYEKLKEKKKKTGGGGQIRNAASRRVPIYN